MRNVKNKMFGPTDDVLLDGTRFVDCSFRECRVHYSGHAVKFKGCHFDRCSVVLGGSAGTIVETLRYMGFDLVAVGTTGNDVLNRRTRIWHVEGLVAGKGRTIPIYHRCQIGGLFNVDIQLGRILGFPRRAVSA